MNGPRDWGRPEWLLVALAVAVGLAGVAGASTGAGAYGTFNPSWDGGSELRATVADAGTEPYVILESADYDALDPTETAIVVLSPAGPYDDGDRERLARYVENGGTLVVAEDFRPHANPLLRAVGARARVTGRPLRDDLRNTRTSAFPLATGISHERSGANDGDPTNAALTRGVEALALNHPSTVAPNGATVLVNSSRFAYVDSNRNATLDAGERVGRYPVVTTEPVGAGRVVVASDPSLFVNAMQETESNRRFVENVARTHERVGIDETHAGTRPPLAVALVVLRRDPLLQVVVGGFGLGVVLLGGRYGDRATRLVEGGEGDRVTGADPVAARRARTALLRSRETIAKWTGADEAEGVADDE